ncbi:Spo0E like sporulation regulatory protein [Hathewaya histolytica]|uniref:Spo0E like sporulation regulatory protein n=1 Tax=Hathewaya histolytica TaxID=1498 RepID=A0A4V6KD12_HATHI|nr:Uncharacterised protein [Hathewaya histolytica]
MNSRIISLEVRINFYKRMLNFLLNFISTNNFIILKLSKKLDKYISQYQKLKLKNIIKTSSLAA